MTLRVLSLFSGAGGADLALEAAGFEIVGLCEIEPHARAVLRHHWPDVPLHEDVRTLDGTLYRGVDVVVGGFPCQDLSVAGKRAGLAEGSGTRSSLFYDALRIWEQSQSTYLILENVKGLFSSNQGADFAAVLSAIVGRTVPVRRDGWSNAGVVCGPTAVAAWRLLDLQHFGVPQRRERIVVLAARAGGVDPAEVLAVSQSLRWDSAPRFQAREGAARDVAPRPDPASAVLTYDARGNGNGVVANTLAGDHQNRVTDYTALVVGEQARTLAFKVRGGVEVDSAGKTAGKGYLGSEEVAFTLSGTQDQQIHQPAFRMVAFGEYAEDGTASAIKARDFKDATDLAIGAPGVPRRLMPIECERLMGWPDSWTRWGVNEKGVRYELADTPRYKLCGNGIGREWMEWVALRLMEAEGLTSNGQVSTLEA